MGSGRSLATGIFQGLTQNINAARDDRLERAKLSAQITGAGGTVPQQADPSVFRKLGAVFGLMSDSGGPDLEELIRLKSQQAAQEKKRKQRIKNFARSAEAIRAIKGRAISVEEMDLYLRDQDTMSKLVLEQMGKRKTAKFERDEKHKAVLDDPDSTEVERKAARREISGKLGSLRKDPTLLQGLQATKLQRELNEPPGTQIVDLGGTKRVIPENPPAGTVFEKTPTPTSPPQPPTRLQGLQADRLEGELEVEGQVQDLRAERASTDFRPGGLEENLRQTRALTGKDEAIAKPRLPNKLAIILYARTGERGEGVPAGMTQQAAKAFVVDDSALEREKILRQKLKDERIPDKQADLIAGIDSATLQLNKVQTLFKSTDAFKTGERSAILRVAISTNNKARFLKEMKLLPEQFLTKPEEQKFAAHYNALLIRLRSFSGDPRFSDQDATRTIQGIGSAVLGKQFVEQTGAAIEFLNDKRNIILDIQEANGRNVSRFRKNLPSPTAGDLREALTLSGVARTEIERILKAPNVRDALEAEGVSPEAFLSTLKRMGKSTRAIEQELNK